MFKGKPLQCYFIILPSLDEVFKPASAFPVLKFRSKHRGLYESPRCLKVPISWCLTHLKKSKLQQISGQILVNLCMYVPIRSIILNFFKVIKKAPCS